MNNYRIYSYNKLIWILVFSLLSFACLLTSNFTAHAGTGDNYPWKSSRYPTCYPTIQAGDIDTWGYCKRNCTSWAAWALHDRNGFEIPNIPNNAQNWGTWASSNGYTVDTTPSVGSIAWWYAGALDNGYTIDPSGHVAWVSAVSGNTATIEEYNYGATGMYHTPTRNITHSSTQQVQYIHFADIAPPPPPPKKSDIVWVEPSGTAGLSTVSAIPSTGFGWTSSWVAGGWNNPTQVAAGDFTGDGKSDLAWIEPNGSPGLSKLSTIPSTGSGWGAAWVDNGWNNPSNVVAGDYNGDGRTDLAWIEPNSTPGLSSMTVLLSTGSSWTFGWSVSGWDTPTSIASGDFTGDGKSDIAWIQPSGTSGLSKLYVIPSTGSGWTSAWSVQTWNTPTNVVTGDFNGDSKSDLVWIEPSGTIGYSTISMIPSTGSSWTSSWVTSGWNNPTQVVAEDFTGDGKSDLGWVEPSGTSGLSKLTVVPSTGSSWAAAWATQTWNTPTNVVSGDFNGS